MTTSVEAIQSILSRFETFWADRTPIIMEGETRDRSTDGAAVRFTIRHLPSKQGTYGNVGLRRFDRLADVYMEVFIPQDQGRTPADLLIEEFRSLFEGVQFDGIRAFEVSTQEVGVMDGDLKFVARVRVDYEERK